MRLVRVGESGLLVGQITGRYHERVQQVLRSADVISAAYYIVPTRHDRVEIDGNGYMRCVGKDEFDVLEFASSPPVLR